MISKELIPKIEESLGFKLHQPVIDYLTEDKITFNNNGRIQGKTTAHILKQILDRDYCPCINLKELRYSDRYADMNPNRDYKSFYYHMFMEYYYKLKDSGLEVVGLV